MKSLDGVSFVSPIKKCCQCVLNALLRIIVSETAFVCLLWGFILRRNISRHLVVAQKCVSKSMGKESSGCNLRPK